MHPVEMKKKKVVGAVSLALLGLGFFAGPAQAYSTQIGDYDFSLNSTLTAGTAWRVEERDRALYGQNNTDENGVAGTGGSNTGDDGNLNFAKGDTFSTIAKGVHDFELSQRNHGFFGRVKWFYDFTLGTDAFPHGHEPNGNNAPNGAPQKLQDGGFHPFARFGGLDVLDAFGYWNTSIDDKPLDVRLGRQVISWGESTLILSPISGLNTIDVSAFRRPGASLKEGFTPSEMLYANMGVTDSASLEGFYQLKWRKTVIDGCGTYFSTADFAADGCDRLAFVNSAGVDDRTQLTPGVTSPLAAGLPAVPLAVNRSRDRQPGNSGQYGLALRNYFSDLDAELGVYYLNYHNRLPLISVRASATPTPAGTAAATGLTAGNALPYALGGTDGTYFIDYPEDISVIGLSASTNLGGWAVSGELSQALDVPVQYNANDLLAATLTAGVGSASPNPLQQKVRNAQPGETVNGFERFDVTQIQSTLIKTFDRALGSSTVVLVGEVGAVLVSGLPEALPGQRFGRAPVFGNNPSTEGYVSDFSWGYRLRSRATYRNVLGNTDLIPSVAWLHDVKGYSPTPGQAFNEGRRSLGLGLTFEFDANTSAAVNYTTFADSAEFDPLRDRDFMSVNFTVSF